MDIPDGFAQINWRFTGTACPFGAQTTLALNIEGTSETPTSMANLFALIWDARMAPVQTTTTILSEVLVKFGPTSTGPSGSFSTNTNGNIASSGIQPATALLIQKLTAFGGRAGRGRMYMPGLSESDVSESGLLGGAYINAAQDAIDGLATDCISNELVPVLLHGDDSPLSAPSNILEFSVQSRVATQRRRLRR